MQIQKTKTQLKREERNANIITAYTHLRSTGVAKILAYDAVADLCDTTRSTVQRITKDLTV